MPEKLFPILGNHFRSLRRRFPILGKLFVILGSLFPNNENASVDGTAA
jgi:hypothetical protein